MIINADDFGYSQSVNRAVCGCFKEGRINRATIMVNMPHTAEAAELAFANGFADKIGLHLNLTEGKALSEECAKSEVCDENGYFKGTFYIPFHARLYLPDRICRAIYAETEAQMKKFIELGFTLRHLDSHNYVHTYISVYMPIKKLIQKYGFVSARISRNVSEEDFSVPFKIYKTLYNFLLRRLKVNGRKISTTEYFGSVQDFNGCEKKAEYDIELMTHPTYIDGALMDNTLPNPHPFVSCDWIRKNSLHLEDVSKIKLLVCFIHAHIGGAMTSLVNFLNALDTEKYDVDLMFFENENTRYGIKEEINILPQGKQYKKYDALNVFKKMLYPPYMLALIRDRYYKKVKHNKRKAVQIMSKQGCKFSRRLYKRYDIAVAYEFNWCMNYVINCVNAKKKIIWHHVEYGKSGMDFKIDKKTLDKANALVFVGEECKKSYVEKHPEHGEKSYFIPNLLSGDYVRSKGETEICLPFEDNPDCLKLLTVARIRFQDKGLDRAVMVFSRLKKDGLLENVKWLIIGDGRDMPELRKMIRAEGLEEYIYPIGLKENPIPYYKKCDAFFLPSRHEGKPMVVTEAFIMGLVPIVTEYTSARGQIRHGVDGLIFDNNDEALYNGLKRLLESPEVLCDLKETVSKTDYGNEREISAFYELLEKII